jgi:hypothetical protein
MEHITIKIPPVLIQDVLRKTGQSGRLIYRINDTLRLLRSVCQQRKINLQNAAFIQSLTIQLQDDLFQYIKSDEVDLITFRPTCEYISLIFKCTRFFTKKE